VWAAGGLPGRLLRHRADSPSTRQLVDQELTEHIRHAHQRSKGRYGAPRIHAQLRRDGHRHRRKRIARLMRAAGLHGRTPRRFKRTTIADPAAAARADLVRRDFAVTPRRSHPLVWRHHLHLDLGGLAVPGHRDRHRLPPDRGFAMAEHLRTELACDALTNAVAARDPAPGLVFHADRGCQYTSGDYALLAGDLKVRLSTGRTGQCWDCDDPPALPRSA
jgi:putative transposase